MTNWGPELDAATCEGCREVKPFDVHLSPRGKRMHLIGLRRQECTSKRAELLPIVERAGHLAAAEMAERCANAPGTGIMLEWAAEERKAAER